LYLFAQSNHLFEKVTPIVQIFGTASYNFDEYKYEYNFGRAHLGFKYDFNEKWSAKIIIDRGRATSVGEITVTDLNGNELMVQNASKEGAYYTMFLKFASLQWKINDKLTLEGGAILQNHYITQERFWGLRYVAQTFQDLYWKISSSDLGFIAYYKVNNAISIDAAITNGEGPRVKQDTFGKIKMAVGININPIKNVQSRIFYHNRQSTKDNNVTEELFSAFIGYKLTSKFRIGGEFNYIHNIENCLDLNSWGYSFYGIIDIDKKTNVFARFDRLLFEEAPIESLTVIGNGNSVMGGVSHSPIDKVQFSLNYQGWLTKDGVKALNRVMLSMEYKF
jgi:hypothetical protein